MTTSPVTSGLPSAAGRRRRAALAGGLYAGALAVLVLTPISTFLLDLTLDLIHGWDGAGLPGHPGVPLAGGVLNVLLFLPFGAVLVPLTRRPWYVVAAVAFLVSGGIELVQLWPALHRDASLADVLCNGTGGLVGAWLADRRRPTTAVRVPAQRATETRLPVPRG